MTPHALMPALFIPLILFALYRRVRGTFGRQLIKRRRLKWRIGILSIALPMMAIPALFRLDIAAGIILGALIGAALGFLGLRLTRFEITADGQELYIPNPYIGGALTAILISRLVYRFITLNALTAPDAQAGPPVNPWTTGQSSPLTLGIIAVLMGYYLVYFAGVLREGKKHGVA